MIGQCYLQERAVVRSCCFLGSMSDRRYQQG